MEVLFDGCCGMDSVWLLGWVVEFLVELGLGPAVVLMFMGV